METIIVEVNGLPFLVSNLWLFCAVKKEECQGEEEAREGEGYGLPETGTGT